MRRIHRTRCRLRRLIRCRACAAIRHGGGSWRFAGISASIGQPNKGKKVQKRSTRPAPRIRLPQYGGELEEQQMDGMK